MNTVFKKGLRSWSKVRTIIAYRKLMRISIKIFRPVLKITNRRIMKYVSMVTIFTMVFGLSFWSVDFNSAYADSISIGASKDSWIDQKSSKADSNHGDDDDNDLLVRSETSSKNKRLLVAFDLPDLFDDVVIDSATLILHTKNDPPTSRTYGAHRINEDWEELEVTWNNRPDAELSATSTTLTNGVVDDEDMSWDVTSDIQDFYDESLSNYGWMIQDETEGNSPSKESKFRSREYSSDITERPELQIEYHLDLPDGSISGYKFNDLNGDGFWDQEGENPEPGLANWTITLSNGDETTTDGNGYYIFEELEDDDYTICEVIPDDDEPWTQTKPSDGAGCEGGINGYSVEISNGNEVANNNFGNVQYARIVVRKETNDISDDGQGFNFMLAQGDLTVGEISLSDGESDTFNNLLAGPYTITEDGVPGGWNLESVYCEYDDEETGVSVENGEQVILEAGDVVTCTFTNTKLSTFSFEKIADPNEGSFDFTLSGPDGFNENVTLGPDADDDEWELENLTPGEYTLTETLPENWQGGSQMLLCNGNDGDIEQDLAQTDGSVTFGLSAGELLSCTLNNTENALISGIKFEDSDGAGESVTGNGLEGWTITATEVLVDNPETEEDESAGEPQSFSDTTDGDGNYSIQVPAGTWTVCETQQDETWSQSYPIASVENSTSCSDSQGYEVTVAAGGGETGLDFGNYRDGSISGIKWEDLNADGEFDEEEEESVLGGWVVFLDLNENSVLDEDEPYQETDEDGFYSFENLAPGTYVIREASEEGWMQIFPGDNTDDKHTVTVISGEEEQNWNFGNFRLITVTGFKWDDKNGDGVWQKENEENSGEPGLQDVIVALGRVNGKPTQEDGHEVIPIEIIALSLTGVDGGFQIRDVAPGHYKLFEEKKSGWQATNPAPSIDSFFDITYRVDGDPDFDLLRLRNPDFNDPASFFDVFAELSGQDVNQSEAMRTDLITIPSVPLEFGNHQLSVISEESAPKINETSVTITWNTDRQATSRVIYDTVSHSILGNGLCPSPLDALECYGYVFSTPESDLEPKVFEHSVDINDLTAGTTYYFRSVSHASPESVGSEGSFNTQSLPSYNGGGSDGGGAPGGIILDGPTLTPQTNLGQTTSTSIPTPTPFIISAPLFVAGATTGDGSEISGSPTLVSDFEEELPGESDRIISSPSVKSEVPEEDQRVSDNSNLFASLFGIFSILNSASFWWLVIIVVMAAIFFRIKSKKR